MKSHLELRRLNPASNRSARRSRRLPSALVGAALLAVPSTVRAQTWNDVTGNWSVAGNWTPSGVPAGADNVSNTTSLVFGGANAYTSTLNVGAASSTFGVNALTFNNSSAAGVTLTLADGRTLTFAGTVANPSITQNGSAPVAINGTLLLRDNVGPSGANGTTNFLGAGAGDLSITEVRFNVNNSPVLQLDGSYNTTIGSFYKQQGNKTITNNTVAGKTLTIGSINLQTNNNNNQLTINGAGDTVVTGSIFATLGAAGTNGGTLVKAGAGSLTLAGNNTITGNINVNQGTLNVSNLAPGGNLGNGVSAIALGSANEATFNYTGNSATHARGFNIGGAGGARINTTTAGQTLTIDTFGINGSSGTLKVGGAGDTVINPAISLGFGGLQKLDAGTLTLNSANSYSGVTSVAGGTLVTGAAGALGSSNVFNISPGAVLNAAVGGINVNSGGFLTAGRSSGFATDVWGDVTLGTDTTLTVAGIGTKGTLTQAGNLTLSAGTALRFDLNSVTTPGAGVNDLVAVSGNLTLPTGTDTVAVNLTAANGPLAPGNYTLFTYGGSLDGGGGENFAQPTGLTPGRSTYSYDTTTTPGSVFLVVTGATGNLTWGGNGSTNPWDASTTGVFTGASPDHFFDGDVVNFTDSGAANGTVSLDGNLQPFAVNVNAAANYTFTGVGAIAGPGTLNKSGTGTLTIDNANTFTGATNVSGGTLVVAAPQALGDTATGTTVSVGAQVRVTGGINVAEPFTISGTGVANAGALHNGAGANTVSGTVTLAGDALIANADTANAFTIDVAGGVAVAGAGGTLTVETTGDVAINGAINLGAGNLVKTGAGKLTLGGGVASTGTGTTFVNAGTLELAKTTNVNAIANHLTIGDGVTPATVRLLVADQISNSGIVTVNAGSTFDLNGKAETAGSLAGSGSVTSATPAVLTLTTANFTGVLSGPLGLTKANAGTLSLLGAQHTFTGTLQANNGVLEVDSLADTGAGSNGIGTIRLLNGNNAAAALRYVGAAAATISRPIEIFATGAGVGLAGIDSSGAGPLVFTGGASLLNSVTTKSLSLEGTNTGDNTYAGLIANGSGTLGLNKDGPGHWIVSNAGNTFSGNVSVVGGTLRIPNAGALGTGTKTVSIGSASFPSLLLDGTAGDIVLPATVNFAISSDGTGGTPGAIANVAGDNVINGTVSLVNASGGNGRLTAAAGTLTVAGPVNANGATGVRTLLLGGAATGTINGVVSDGVTNGNARVVSVRKDGSGTWTISGANTYTGTTTVAAGTLVLAPGGSFGAGAVTVSGTGTLAGVGSIASSLLVTGGTLAPGLSTGILTLNNGLSITAGALAVEINGVTPGAGHDQLVVTAGNVSLGSGVGAITGAVGYTPAVGDTIWLIDNTGSGATTGFLNDADANPLVEGSAFTLGGHAFTIHYGADVATSQLTGGNDVALVATNAVPEPASAGIAIAAVAVGLLRRRRTHRR